MARTVELDRLKPLKDTVCVVGVGESDYLNDYRAGAKGNATEKGSGAMNSYQLAATALRRALDDAGLTKDDIDGLVVGGPMSTERTCEVLGINASWCVSGDAPRGIVAAVQAINAGLCHIVALVYGNAQRSMDTAYGGPRASGAGILSYVYYAPWGMTSQGGLYSMMFRRHQLVYGTTEEQLGAVAVAFRKHASMNPNAVMYEKPITIEDYMNSRYISEPFHLFDYCLINDGGVAFIIQRADMAKNTKHTPINISGLGWSELDVDSTQLRPRLKDFYYPAHHNVREQIYPMAGVTPKDVDVYATYDSFSTHLLFSLEGFGFCKEGEGGAFIQGGRIEIGGELPCNTSGGMLSESYMQSWNHQPELIRQLRHQYEGTERQVNGAEVAQYVHDVAGKCLSVIYTRGN
jgi:acetyl-CoA acetyltransferase